jgi:hypothetical protein
MTVVTSAALGTLGAVDRAPSPRRVIGVDIDAKILDIARAKIAAVASRSSCGGVLAETVWTPGSVDRVTRRWCRTTRPPTRRSPRCAAQTALQT